jgi:NTE family protein
MDALLGAIDVMQERIAQTRLVSEPPDVLLTPRLGKLGPFDYHRAAVAIAEGRAVVAQNLPEIRGVLVA